MKYEGRKKASRPGKAGLRGSVGTPGLGHSTGQYEYRYQELFKGMACGAVIYQPTPDLRDFVIIDFNPAAERIEKVSRHEIIGKKVTEIFPGVHEMGILDIFTRVARTGLPENMPPTIYRDDIRAEPGLRG